MWVNCATQLRRAHIGNGAGSCQPKRRRRDPTRLVNCTWSRDCKKCAQNPEGQLAALRRQRAEAGTHAGMDDRFLRLSWTGDWMSVSVPLGAGPPTSKKFCTFCYASLHDTNRAGVPHMVSSISTPPPLLPSLGLTPPILPCQRENICEPCDGGFKETRDPEHAKPRYREGTRANEIRARALHLAMANFKAGRGRKPEAADHDSCLELPLIWALNPLSTISTTTLHLMLGQGLELVNKLEDRLKLNDYEYAIKTGRKPEDADLALKVVAASTELTAIRDKIIAVHSEISNHENCMEVIAAIPGTEEAIAAGKLKAKRGKKAKAPLMYEEKYRAHFYGLQAKKAELKPLHAAEKKGEKKVVDLWYAERGSFTTAFDKLMDDSKLQRCAWFSGTMNGSDVHDIFQPELIKKFSDLLRRKITAHVNTISVYDESTESDTCSGVSLLVALDGSNGLADGYFKVMTAFGNAISLVTRVEPLCDHERADYRRHYADYARAYATLFPHSEPHPKGHMMGYHVAAQQDEIGSSGQFGEGPVESVHVRDNELARRNHNLRDKEMYVQARAKAHLMMTCPALKNIRDHEHKRAYAKRQVQNAKARDKRAKPVAKP